jgi:hypothetical protein
MRLSKVKDAEIAEVDVLAQTDKEPGGLLTYLRTWLLLTTNT